LREIGCRWARFYRLPPYAPELNPVEHVWSTAKWGRLANVAPSDAAAMWSNVDQTLSAQSCEQRLLKAHFRWAGLELA
jgi:transposase